MFCKKLSLLSVTFFLFILSTSNIKAASIYENDFSDNVLPSELMVSNYVPSNEGSFATVSDNVVLNAINEEIKISGVGTIDTIRNDEEDLIGNIGKALVLNEPIFPSSPVRVEVDVEIVQSSNTWYYLFFEFDKDNRITFTSGFENFGFIQMDQFSNNFFSLSIHDMDWGNNVNVKLDYFPDTNIVNAYVNDKFVTSEVYKGREGYFKAGFAATVRFPGDILDYRFDNFKVYTLEEEDQLDVPYLSQSDDDWGDDEYDHASERHEPDPSMSRWACALTSANMILQYNGFDVNPGELNEWLKNRADGFSPSGGVMWNTIGKYSKDNNGSNTPETDDDNKTLEFEYLSIDPTEDNIKKEIEEGRPPILKLANKFGGEHFIVGTGIDGDDILVNDPGREENETLSDATDYWGNVIQIGRYTPTNSDLSYMIFMIGEQFDLELYKDGELVASGFTEGPIVEATGERNTLLGDPLNAIYYPKPEKGTYELVVSNAGLFQLNSYLYDVDGNDNQDILQGLNTETKNSHFIIEFDKDSEGNVNAVVSSSTSFDSLVDDLNYLYENEYFLKRGAYRSTLSLIQNAKKMKERGNVHTSKVLLSVALDRIKTATPKQLVQEYSDYLQQEINNLVENLNS